MSSTATQVMGFDFGTRSIGVAMGNRVSGTAAPLNALKAQDGAPNWQALEALLNKWQPELIVVGLPLNMDGTEQELTQRARRFANRIHGRFGYPIELHDERLTTVDAKERLFELGGYRKLEKGMVDSVSAVLIVESWFESHYC